MKRILTFIVVTALVLSMGVIGISAEDFTEGTNQWTLPMNWATGTEVDDKGWDTTKMGNWFLTNFEDPSDVETILDNEASGAAAGAGNSGNVGPAPYIESTNNRKSTVGADGYTSWYVNAGPRWTNGVIFATGGSFIKVGWGKSSDYSVVHPTVVFTAPEDGTYSFSEAVTGFRFVDDANEPFSATATVRKNGDVLATFTPTEGNATKTIEGSVALKKGDLLMFTFTLDTEGADFKVDGSDVDGADQQAINLGATVVRKTGAYPAGGNDNQGGNTGSSSPATGDAMVAVAALALASAAAVVVVSKKRR